MEDTCEQSEEGSDMSVRTADQPADRPFDQPSGQSQPSAQPDSGARLAGVAAAGWPAVETEELGGWLLQASAGFTGRANSVVPAGDPGLLLDAALGRVNAFYARRRLPTLIQVVVGTGLEAALRERGWRVHASGKSPHATVDVQVAPVAEALAANAPAGSDEVPYEVEVTAELDEEWLRMYGRDPGPTAAATAAARHVLGSPEVVGFARIRRDNRLAGVGRAVVTGPWVGIAAVEVAPPWRRRGLGRALMRSLGSWGSDRGASWVYLQVGSDNGPALRMYERLGFRTDHRYRYYTPGRT
jgi:N-acetylglutamate synthase